MYSKIEPLITAPGGITAFGYQPKIDTGRFTPMYSTDFLTKELQNNIKQLNTWEATHTIFQGYTNIIEEIQTTAYETQAIIVEAINDTLQVSATEALVSLNSSYIEGNLYYEQSYYNFNMTNASAVAVEAGPVNYEELKKDCQREEKWKAAMSIIGATGKLAAACIDPFVLPATATSLAKFGKGVNAIATMASTSVALDNSFTSVIGKLLMRFILLVLVLKNNIFHSLLSKEAGYGIQVLR